MFQGLSGYQEISGVFQRGVMGVYEWGYKEASGRLRGFHWIPGGSRGFQGVSGVGLMRFFGPHRTWEGTKWSQRRSKN